MKVVKEYRLEHRGDDVADAVQMALWHKRDNIKLTEAKKHLDVDTRDLLLSIYFVSRANLSE